MAAVDLVAVVQMTLPLQPQDLSHLDQQHKVYGRMNSNDILNGFLTIKYYALTLNFLIIDYSN